MASGSRRSRAGERVLESRHVIGLFLLMLVFSGVFFTLGYVMGRSQYDSQVRAASTNDRVGPGILSKPEPVKKGASRAVSEPSPDIPSQPDSDWTFYKAAKAKEPEENLRPAAPTATNPAAAANRGKTGKAGGSQTNPGGGYTLQVAALRTASDALALSEHLKKKNFPAFVASPQGDKYYRVQVGPYPDQKSAETARKGLEGAGFKAIVKH